MQNLIHQFWNESTSLLNETSRNFCAAIPSHSQQRRIDPSRRPRRPLPLTGSFRAIRYGQSRLRSLALLQDREGPAQKAVLKWGHNHGRFAVLPTLTPILSRRAGLSHSTRLVSDRKKFVIANRLPRGNPVLPAPASRRAALGCRVVGSIARNDSAGQMRLPCPRFEGDGQRLPALCDRPGHQSMRNVPEARLIVEPFPAGWNETLTRTSTNRNCGSSGSRPPSPGRAGCTWDIADPADGMRALRTAHHARPRQRRPLSARAESRC